LLLIFTLPEILRERRVKIRLQSGSVAVCEAVNTFGDVEPFAPPFSSLHPLLVFMCVFSRLFLLLLSVRTGVLHNLGVWPAEM